MSNFPISTVTAMFQAQTPRAWAGLHSAPGTPRAEFPLTPSHFIFNNGLWLQCNICASVAMPNKSSPCAHRGFPRDIPHRHLSDIVRQYYAFDDIQLTWYVNAFEQILFFVAQANIFLAQGSILFGYHEM